MKITDIFQYPVKGLSPESLSSTELVLGVGMPADRVFAITHGKSQFSFEKPAWVPRKNFAVVAKSPEICTIEAQFNHESQTLTLAHDGVQLLSEHVEGENVSATLTNAINQVIKEGKPGPTD